MNLQPQEQEELRSYVGKLLDNGVVGYGTYLAIPVPLMFEVNETLEKVRVKVEKQHGGKGLPDLVKNSLFSLIDVDTSTTDAAPLSTCISLARDEAIAAAVSDLTSTLPQLAFIFILPKSWTERLKSSLGLPIRGTQAGFGSSEFFDQTKIVPSTDAVRQRIFRPKSLLGIRLTGEQAREFLAGKGGLVVAGEGLHGAYATDPLDAATDLVAAICATLAVYGFLEFKPNWDTSDSYVPVFRRHNAKLQIWDTAQRRPDLAEFERRFGLSDQALSEDEALALRRALIIVMSTIGEAAPISLALYWLFRTFLDRSGHENILDVAISLEIMAGSRATKDDPSISSSIAYKVAYALGKSHRARTEIEKTIKKFYGLRSAVIHAGKRRLTEEEKVLVYATREHCKQFIKHEISVLGQDLDWTVAE